MNKTRHYIRTLLLMLLLLAGGGTGNGAWAQKVTYHILTKPFTVMNHNNSGPYKEHIRVEALQCTSEEETVGLPEQFKSPLATNFQYWATATSQSYGYLYDYEHNTNVISAKYYIYQCTALDDYACLSDKITNPEKTSSDAYTDIYVTYDYYPSNGIIKLDGGTYYNISIDVSGTSKFMCLNRSRNNRVSNAFASALTGEELSDNDFVVPENGKQELGWPWGSGDNKIWGLKGVHLGFKFLGEDPYNITIMTSYTGDEVHVTDNVTSVDGSKATIKPFKGATLFGKMGNDQMWFDVSNDRHYKILSGMSNSDVDLKTGDYKDLAKYEDCKTRYKNTAESAKYDTWVGFYRKESYAEVSTYALLPNPNGDYLFVASKMNMGKSDSKKPDINQPANSDQYYVYNDNGSTNKPNFTRKAFSNAYKTRFYEIKTYTVHVTTKGSSTPLSATMKWSDARLSETIVDHIPDVIRRKYVNYTAYSDAAHKNPVSTFEDIKNASNGNNIYLDYTVSENIPFKLLPTDGDYKDAQWYTMRMDGVSNPKYIAYKKDDSNDLVVTDNEGDAKGSNTASQVHQGENSAEAMVAFMGDPYELRILNRKACETDGGNKFVGCDDPSGDDTGLYTNKTGTSDISTWEIVYESIGVTGILLRQFNTASSTPKYIGLGSAANDKPVTYSETASRIRVVELEKVNYTYHIMRSDGSIAVKATVNESVGKPLQNWLDIPAIIRSPFLATATVTYYDQSNNVITNAPYDFSSNHDIYVRYSFETPPSAGSDFNVTLNAEYIYTSSGNDNIYSKGSISEDDALDDAYQWTLDYTDPYAVKITNKGKNKYIKIASTPTDNMALGWDAIANNAALFVVKQSVGNPGFYEVMYAAGETYDAGDGVDITTQYFNVGRNISSTTENTVKLYKNTSYISGSNQLRFRLIGTTARDVTYHLIDLSKNELLQVTTRHVSGDLAYFPPRYRSPLVSNYYYYTTEADAKAGNNKVTTVTTADIYVTYDVNDLVDLKAGQLYLMKYLTGEEFYQENGGDGRTTTKKKAIYPYCNGDGNFFIYDQDQYDLQQEGASSTRTRWAWYVESNVESENAPKGDPYHVMIKSRQTELYPITNSSEYNAYFMTYKPNGYDKVITGLGWAGMNSETATEYMVLGSEGQYQLVTTYTIPIDLNNDGDTEDEGEKNRYVVSSFEQYWKTYDTIRRKLLKQSKGDYPDNDNDPILVPSTPCLVTGFDDNRTYLTTSTEAATPGLGFHSYEKWAYAKRWNGYNNGYSSTEGTHETSKGWEKIEHWFQTVNMGEGYFDFVKTDINPVIILLDQHGWEIMRKPIPTDPEDPLKDAKYAAIRPYNSPMVKEYAFWATAKKRSGFHQYYLLSDRIGGDDFTSTDLTSLPPYTSKNVHDKKGNLNDQYVTYIVKDEYAQTYNPADKTAKPFLIEQGVDHKYATTNADGTILTASDIPHGDMKAHILNDNINDNIYDTEKWYVKPNANIDVEMGYNDASHSWDAKTPNAYESYEDSKYSYETLRTSIYIDQTDDYKNADPDEKKKIKDKYGFFSFSNGFDPYNIQISSVKAPSKYMKTNANGATLEEGSLVGSYPTDPNNPTDPDPDPKIAMGDNTTTISPAPKWYDSRNLAVTNATFMAVQDAAGNMQLMPRFDHVTRMSEFGELIAPTDAEVAKTYTKLYRPEVYEYLIIDNSGKESLRYKSGGDLTPQTPDHFRSPLATNFKYYATATKTVASAPGVEDTYSNITNEIEESLDGATLTENTNGNKVVYVRYEYDEETDSWNMLKGNWLTMQLNDKNAVYDNGMKQASGVKPSPIDNDDKQWQWKFAHNSQPDPYAIYIYNRSQSAGTKVIIDLSDRFALLYHSAGDYALAKAGEGTYTYSFLNGYGMNTTTAASVAVESGFTPTSDTFDETKSQVRFIDEVTHNFTYKVYTNGGVEAIRATQSQDDVSNYDWKPRIPNEIKTPLLNLDQFRYYSKDDYERSVDEKPDTIGKNLSSLYGLYDDEMVVRYTPYKPSVTEYQVPNVRNDVTTADLTDNVAKGIKSNDAPIGLDGKSLYNIIWYTDYMMKSNEMSITSDPNQELHYSAPYEWVFEGDDPYAIKIKSVGATKYIHTVDATTTELSTTATPFMLLNRDGYTYGVFAKTGNKDVMLSGYGQALVTDDHDDETTSDNPTHFIPFALSTYKVIYHLIIANICTDEANPVVGQYVDIPYSEKDKDGNWKSGYSPSDNKTKRIFGTTLRNLKTKDGTGDGHFDGDYYQLGSTIRSTTYCYDAGHVSLGDAFEIPQAFYRPNVSYDYYIGGIYNHDTSDEYIGSANTEMNNLYKGLKMTNMGEDTRLLEKIVWVNVVYSFMGGLETNSGSGFVTGVDDNKWYTFETSGATPQLTEYADELKTASGYATHYTNDYLWTPVGDPYGFKMYNRYIQKNLGQNMVMSTENFNTDTPVQMVVDNKIDPDDGKSEPHLPANSVYELLANSSTTPGYFRIHPVANKKTTSDPQYYIKNDDGALKLNTTPTEWTFGLSEELMRPYYQAAGYVGGLNDAGKNAYDKVCDDYDKKIINEFTKLITLQDVVYNHDNNNSDPDNPNFIVHYAPGYYRLHSQPGSSDISTPRYASGYTHKIELTAGPGAIPMHFYEVEEYDVNNPTFKDLGTAGTDYTVTDATRGDIPLVTVDKDPASIFRFTGDASSATMSTQGLYVYQNKMDKNNGTLFKIIDIGGGVVALQSGDDFLKYAKTGRKYDLKFDHEAATIESTRWCMQPVQKDTKAGNGEMALTVTTNNGGDENYYTTFYAPFDVLLTDVKDEAFVLPELPDGGWPTTKTIIHPKKIGQYNTVDNNCPEMYRGNDRFIPAGTPVIIRTKNTGGEITMALPTATPSKSISNDLSGEYLEQMLAQSTTNYVFAFGRRYTHSNEFGYDKESGIVTPAGLEVDKGVGFYINASNNRESNATKTMWTRNNKYVYGNKIYYLYTPPPGDSRELTRSPEFIPVVFDDEEGEEDEPIEDSLRQQVFNGCVYDLQGRCVATEEMVKDGTWRHNLKHGIYILNGKKVYVK